MKKLRPRPVHPSPGGFTLVELLVSMTVLALLLVMVSQMTNSTSRTVAASGKRVDADSQSRLVFSRIGQDLARMAKRKDVDFSTFKQPAYTDPANSANNRPKNLQDGSDPVFKEHNDHLAFYSEIPGGYTPAGTATPGSFSALTARAPLSVVAYQVAAEPNGGTTTLRRMAKALGWDPDSGGTWAAPVYLPLKLTDLQINSAAIQLFSPDSTDPASKVDADYATIGDMVFRFEYSYLLKAKATNTANPNARLSVTPYDTSTPTAHTPANGLQDVAAIVVTLGILDSASQVITSKDKVQVAKLIGVFKDAVDGQDTLQTWQAALLDPAFATKTGLPPAAASAVRLYQRTFYLESN